METPSFTCPVCQMTSYHPQDVQYGYCGNCKAFTGDKDIQIDPVRRRFWLAEPKE